MNIKVVGSCYYHPERSAVAICPQCNAGICRECAVTDDSGRVICYRCGNSNLKQEHKKYREMLKQQGGRFRNGTEFIIPSIIGIIILVVTGLAAVLSGNANLINTFKDIGTVEIIAGAMLAYMLFSIPFCMTMLNDLFAPKYDTMHNRFDKWYIKACISLFVGWIVFTFYWIRFIVTKIRKK